MQLAMPSERFPTARLDRHLSAPAWLSLLLAPLLLIAAVTPTAPEPERTLGLIAMTAVMLVGQLLTLRHLAVARAKASEADRLARVDPLTGLGNRRALYEDLDREARRARRMGREAALIVADLDGFKQVNDSLGHARGDAVLQAFAAALAGQTRGDVDRSYRLGGDEFVVVLPEADDGAARVVADRIGHAFEVATKRLAPSTALGCSFGVATLGADDVIGWLSRADAEMYADKSGDHVPSPP